MLHSTGRGMGNQAVENSSTLEQSLNRCFVAEEKDRHLQPLGKMSQSCFAGRKMTNFIICSHQTSAGWLRNVHSAALMHRLLSLTQARPTTVSMRSTPSQRESCETSRVATCTAAPRKQPRVELMDLLGSFPHENSWDNFSTIRTTL